MPLPRPSGETGFCLNLQRNSHHVWGSRCSDRRPLMGYVYHPGPLRQRVGGQRDPLAHAGSRRTPLYRVCPISFPVHISQTRGLKQNFISHSPGHQKSKTEVAAGTRSPQGLLQPLVVAGVHSLGATGLQPLHPPLHDFSLCLLSYKTLAVILREAPTRDTSSQDAYLHDTCKARFQVRPRPQVLGGPVFVPPQTDTSAPALLLTQGPLGLQLPQDTPAWHAAGAQSLHMQLGQHVRLSRLSPGQLAWGVGRCGCGTQTLWVCKAQSCCQASSGFLSQRKESQGLSTASVLGEKGDWLIQSTFSR